MAGKSKPRLHFIQYFNPFYVVQHQQTKKIPDSKNRSTSVLFYMYLIVVLSVILCFEFPSSAIAQFSSPIVNNNYNNNNFWNRPHHRRNNNNNNGHKVLVQKFGHGESAVRFGVNDDNDNNDDDINRRQHNNNYFPSVNQFSRNQNNPFTRTLNNNNNNQFFPLVHSSAEYFPHSQREIRTSNNNNNQQIFSRNNQQPFSFNPNTNSHSNNNGRGHSGDIVRFPGENVQFGQQFQAPVQFQQSNNNNNNQRQTATPGISFGQQQQQINDNSGRRVETSSSCVTLDGQSGRCQQFSSCAVYMPEFVLASKSKGQGNASCRQPDGSIGLCCRDLKQNPAETPNSPVNSIKETEAFIFNRLGGMNGVLGIVNENSVEDSIQKSKIYFNDYDRIEKGLLDRNLAIKRGTSSHGHLQFFRTSKRAIDLSRLGQNLLQSTKELSLNVNSRLGSSSNRENSIEDIGVGLKNVNVAKSTIGQQCPARVSCDIRSGATNYRSIDGSCNNLKEPSLGTSFSTLIRLISPQYSDGIWSPRIAVDGSQLPSARLLSSVFNQDIDSPNTDYSLFVMQFGQFLDHDLSHVPVNRYSNGSGIECCTSDGDFLPVTLTHPHCLPIEIPSNDGFYRPFRQHCMNFVRSMVGPRRDCSFGYADQLNQITSFLDNSNVYGSNMEDHRELREFQGGRLKTEQLQILMNGRRPGQNQNFNFNSSSTKSNTRKGMLPIQTKHLGDDECSNDLNRNAFCFNAGDLRVNEMIGLSVTHLVWFREHNRISEILQVLNPQWNDAKLFEESRKILNAQYQHIIYNEWLPIIVGRNYMEVYGILPQSQGYFKGYDDNIDPGVSNAFAAAAFRMGHTLIQGLLSLLNQAGQIEDELVIHEHFNKPFRLRETRMTDKLLRTMTTTPIQSFDRFITSEVTNRLFQEENKPFGMDLISLNIQRGRDHSIPSYNQYRVLCGLPKANTFEDFRDWIDSADIIGKLKKYYKNVNDVDLFIGGILEKPLSGALLGPTFTCIVGDQFARARKGDRFVYDGGNFPHSLTPGQLKEIRKASFARILCDNSDNLASIQPNAFLVPQQSFNPLLDCKGTSIPRINLELWREF